MFQRVQLQVAKPLLAWCLNADIQKDLGVPGTCDARVWKQLDVHQGVNG